MSDRDLLEKAAKAAGIEGQYFESDNPIHTGIYRAGHDYYWNPLISDSEALRLAVKLHIGVRPHGPDHWQQPNVVVALWNVGDQGGRVVVESGDDPERATRRAIVRAAASLGEKM